MPTQVLLGLKRSYFRFPIYKAIRKVSFLGILDQRSYKGLILKASEFFQIVEKFSFKEVSKLSQINKLLHSDLKVHSSCLIKPCLKNAMS